MELLAKVERRGGAEALRIPTELEEMSRTMVRAVYPDDERKRKARGRQLRAKLSESEEIVAKC